MWQSGTHIIQSLPKAVILCMDFKIIVSMPSLLQCKPSAASMCCQEQTEITHDRKFLHYKAKDKRQGMWWIELINFDPSVTRLGIQTSAYQWQWYPRC
jgi:hypothetical protein